MTPKKPIIGITPSHNTENNDTSLRPTYPKAIATAGGLAILLPLECSNEDIKQFMDWCVEGAVTYPQRKELFEKQKKTVEAEIEHLSRVLDMIKFKRWYYEQAMQDGNEDRVHSMIPDKLPEDIQKMYDHAHKE